MNKAGSHSGEKRIRAKFEPEEDELLKQLVQKYGFDWITISSLMVGRNVRQCRERWSHYLCSETAKRPWTPEEDQILLQTVKEIGTKWCKVITHLNDRTDIQAKTRWLRLTNRKTIHDKNPQVSSQFTSSQPTSQEPTTVDQPSTVKPNPVDSLPKPPQNQPTFSSDYQSSFSPFQSEPLVQSEEIGNSSFPFTRHSDDIAENILGLTFDDKYHTLDSKDPEGEISLLFFSDSSYHNDFIHSYVIDEFI